MHNDRATHRPHSVTGRRVLDYYLVFIFEWFLFTYFYEALQAKSTHVWVKELICASSLISLCIPRLQLTWNFNLPGKLIIPYTFQGSLVKTCVPMSIICYWRHLQWNTKSSSHPGAFSKQNGLFNTASCPLLEFLTPTAYSKQAVKMRHTGNHSCFIHVALHPAFITKCGKHYTMRD